MKSITQKITTRPFQRFAEAICFIVFVFSSFTANCQTPNWESADEKSNSGTGTSWSVNKPTNLVAGDLVLIIITTQLSNDNTNSGFNPPTGFTLIHSEQADDKEERPEIAAYYKISGASEPATYTGTVTNNGETPKWKVIAARITSIDGSNPIGPSTGSNTGKDDEVTLTIPSITTTFNNTLIVAARSVRVATTSVTDPTGMTQEWNMTGSGTADDDTNEPSFHGVIENKTSAGAIGTTKFDWVQDARAAGLVLAINGCTTIGNPTFTLGETSNRCGGAGTVTYTGTSSNATGYTYSLDAASLSFGNSINSSTGEVTYLSSWNGTSTITISAAGCGGPLTATHEVTTTSTPSAPIFVLGSASGRCQENDARNYSVYNGTFDSIVYSLDATSISSGLEINSEIGSVAFPSAFVGSATITATAYQCGSSSNASHIVSTGKLALADDQARVEQNGSKDIPVLLNDDCDIDTTTASIAVNPSNGTVTINTTTGIATYTPNAGYSGNDTFTYQFCSKSNASICSTAVVTVKVLAAFTDDYFNIPNSNCQRTLGSSQTLDVKEKFSTAETAALYTSPQVADIDGDGNHEIVIFSGNGLSNSSPRSAKDIIIYNGQTGATLNTITTPYFSFDGATPMAMADIDGDGDVEIFMASLYARNAVADQKYLFCFDHLGNQLWKSNVQYGSNLAGNASAASVGLADFNGDGIVEVYVYNEIFNAATGVKLCDGGSNGQGFYSTHLSVDQAITVAADVRGASSLELIAGRTVYEVSITNTAGTAGNTMTAYNMYTAANKDGYTGLADFDLDGSLDVAVMANDRQLYIYNPRTMTVMASYNTGGSGLRGPLFIGDVDGNGVPDVGYCRPYAVDMLTYNGTATLNQMWSLATSDDSGETSLTMFDFDQNGVQEIVYRDETELRIFNGTNGSAQTLTSIAATSGTGSEGPIVADIDNDGEAEILVTSEGATNDGNRVAMVVVFESDQNAWAPARKVWNQFAYFNVNVNDDMTIPSNQPNHGTAFYNDNSNCPTNFRSRPLNSFNVQSTVYSEDGCPIAYLPDAEVIIESIYLDNNTNELDINYRVVNRADGGVIPESTPITFYVGNPFKTGATLKSIARTTEMVGPYGRSSSYSITLTGINELDEIYTQVNNDGGTAAPLTFPITSLEECNYANNTVSFTASTNSPLPIELIEFNALRMEDRVEITWSTASEINSDYFWVQRSSDGRNFENLMKVYAAGNSFEVLDYSTVDYSPLEGTSYYRLYQVDFDGQYDISEVKIVNFENDLPFVFPNPASENVNIYNPENYSIEMELHSVSGNFINRSNCTPGKTSFSVRDLPAGVYLLRIYNPLSNKVYTHKVTKT